MAGAGAGPAVDAIVIGAGPNGLAAAITLARSGRSVRLYEAADEVGGGTRSAALTLPGFIHDPCATVHPFSTASPFLRESDLARHGLEWRLPPAPLAHLLSPTRSVVLERDLEAAADALGRDGRAWARLVGPLAREADRLMAMILGPVARPPRHPLLLARFGLPALLPATGLAALAFREPGARALLGGLAAHAMVPIRRPLTSGFGLVLGALAHATGWPVVRGGSGALASALRAEAADLGVEIETGNRVTDLRALPRARVVLLDVTPRQMLEIAASRLSAGYARRLRGYRYGPGVFKVDWALDGPIPWRDPATARAGTVHLGGTIEDVARSGAAVARGGMPKRPFVLLVQATVADPSRAPAGKHTAWAYCHVPNGSPVDMAASIEAQIERHAPGFGDLVLARATRSALEMEAYDANYVGGDINGGLQDARQLVFRPVLRRDPYSTSDPALFLCSSSTPPGGGVHGMCGSNAARSAIRASR